MRKYESGIAFVGYAVFVAGKPIEESPDELRQTLTRCVCCPENCTGYNNSVCEPIGQRRIELPDVHAPTDNLGLENSGSAAHIFLVWNTVETTSFRYPDN